MTGELCPDFGVGKARDISAAIQFYVEDRGFCDEGIHRA